MFKYDDEDALNIALDNLEASKLNIDIETKFLDRCVNVKIHAVDDETFKKLSWIADEIRLILQEEIQKI